MPTPTPQQRKKLRDALISAFPEKSSLEQLLDFELDRKVNQITQDSNLQTVVYKLIERAQAEGWLVELVRAARKENPGNSELAAIALELLSPEQVVENERPGQIPTKSADVKQIRFISELRTRLIIEKQVHDLSRDEEFAEFDFIGFKQTSLTLDFVAFKKADGLNERQIVQLCDKFFEITQMVSYDFRLKPVTRMPNSLLGLIFEDECPNYLIDFIKKQTKIYHCGKSAVIVTWVIHVKQKQIYTHNNPVSLVPPVFIMEGSVFPGLDYLKSFLSA